jgi:hypothetical protein
VLAAVGHDRGEAGKGGDASEIELTKFRQLGDQGCGHDRPDARHGLQPVIDVVQLRGGGNDRRQLLVGLCDPTIEHRDKAADIGTSSGVDRLLKLPRLLLPEFDKLAAARRLRLEGAPCRRQWFARGAGGDGRRVRKACVHRRDQSFRSRPPQRRNLVTV